MGHWPVTELLSAPPFPGASFRTVVSQGLQDIKKATTLPRPSTSSQGRDLPKTNNGPEEGEKKNLLTTVMLTSRIFLRLELSRPKSVFTHPWALADFLFKNPKEVWDGKETTHCGWAA